MKRVRYHKKRHTGHFASMPELLPGTRGGANWIVEESGEHEVPSTINHWGGDAKIAVPLGDSREEEFTRLHELLHAAHSPVENPRDVEYNDQTVTGHSIYMAEELRINSIIRWKMGREWLQDKDDLVYDPGLPEAIVSYVLTVPGPNTIATLQDMTVALWPMQKNNLKDVFQHPIVQALKTALALIGDEESTAYKYVRYLMDFVQTLLSKLYYEYANVMLTTLDSGNIPPWDEVLAVAEFLDRAKAAGERGLHDVAQRAVEEATEDSDLNILAPPTHMPANGKQKIGEDMEAPVDGIRKGARDPGRPAKGPVIWSPLKFTEPLRTRKLKGKIRQKARYKATEAGTSPRYIHRSLIDGQVFARKRSEPGGSVLIDDSGSMSLYPEQVAEIVEAAPAVVIATYAGQGGQGNLNIIAKDGRWVEEENLKAKGGGNDCDLNAIKWLAEQPKPRIWVTDGGVFPQMGDYADAVDECKEFAVKHQINIVETADHAAEVFQGTRALYR